MKKKKNNPVERKQKEILKLTKRKLNLLHSLMETEERYNNLADLTSKSAEEWVNALPIQSLKDLSATKRRSKLGDLRDRDKLKKSSIEILNSLRKIDEQIRIANLDLVVAKINVTLENCS